MGRQKTCLLQRLLSSLASLGDFIDAPGNSSRTAFYLRMDFGQKCQHNRTIAKGKNLFFSLF